MITSLLRIFLILFYMQSAFLWAKPLFAESLTLNIDGYVYTCTDHAALYKQEDNHWSKVATLPSDGLYYLDDHYVGYRQCDVVVCNKIESPLIVDLIEFTEIGTKPFPKNSGFVSFNPEKGAPVYKSVSISGKVRYELHYFTDKECKKKKTYTYEKNI